MAFEAYSVSVRLTLVNQVSAGLSLISRGLGTANSDAKALQSELHKIKLLGMGGAVIGAAGFFGLHLMKGPLEEAKKFQTEFTKFKTLGFGDAIDGQSKAYARGMKTIGTSTTENMSLVADAMAVFKDLHHAEFAAPIMAKMKFANAAIYGADKGGEHDRKFMDMLKVIEMRNGLSSQGEFNAQADYVQKAISGSRNRVDASALLQALKTGGVSLSRRSNSAFYLGGEPMIQEFGGMRYGTGAMSLYQNFVQGRGSMTAQNELLRLGLLNRRMIVQNPTTGRMQKVKAGAFLGSKIQMEEGELALLEKVLLPAFAKHGITTDEQILNEIGMIASNRTGSNLLARTYLQRAILRKQWGANEHAAGINESAQLARNTYDGSKIALAKNWKSLLLELGNVILPMAIVGVKGLSAGIVAVTDFAKENQSVIRSLTFAFTGMSVALVAVGGTMGLTAIGTAIKLTMLAMKAAGGVDGAAGLRSALGKAGLAGALITLIPLAYDLSKQFDWIGSKIFDKLHPVGADDKDHPGWHGNTWVGLPRETVRPASTSSRAPVKLTVELDGRQIAARVTHHQADMSRGPWSGMQGTDLSMFPAMAGQ